MSGDPTERDDATVPGEGVGLDRRSFLKGLALSGGLAALPALGTGGCAGLTAPVHRPDPLAAWPDSLLLENVVPIDVEKGVLHPARGVLVHRGRIEALIPAGEMAAVRADRRVDLGGRYLIPGLINAHCHMTLPCGAGMGPGFLLAMGRQRERNAEECIRHGVTTVRDMLAPASWLDDLKEKIARSEIVGPRILRCVAIQVPGGYSARIGWFGGERTLRVVESPEECRRAVREAVESGADFVKTFLQYADLLLPGDPLPLLTDEMLSAIEEEAERCGVAVAAHNTYADGHRRLVAAGIPSLEHMARDAALSDEDVARFVDGGHAFIPTGSVAWALVFESPGDPSWSDEKVRRLAADRASRLAGLFERFAEEPIGKGSLAFVERWSDPSYFEGWRVLPAPDPRFFTAAATAGYENMRRLFDAGARMGCGNDGGVPLIFPGALFLEMAILEEAGIPAPELLRAATATNAEILRMDGEIGSIRPGLRADLVVLERNPLETARNVESVAAVFRDGELLHAGEGLVEKGKGTLSRGFDRGLFPPRGSRHADHPLTVRVAPALRSAVAS